MVTPGEAERGPRKYTSRPGGQRPAGRRPGIPPCANAALAAARRVRANEPALVATADTYDLDLGREFRIAAELLQKSPGTSHALQMTLVSAGKIGDRS